MRNVMKKKRVLLLASVILVLSAFMSPAGATVEDDRPRFSVIVTECGTAIQVSPDLTPEQIVKEMDDQTKKDCDPNDPSKKKDGK